jgi:endonuclease III
MNLNIAFIKKLLKRERKFEKLTDSEKKKLYRLLLRVGKLKTKISALIELRIKLLEEVKGLINKGSETSDITKILNSAENLFKEINQQIDDAIAEIEDVFKEIHKFYDLEKEELEFDKKFEKTIDDLLENFDN